MTFEIKYIGHSAFCFKTDEGSILTDPFISGNPSAKFDIEQEKIINIFLTHGHGDHLGDAIPISRKYRMPITAIFELANYCEEKGAVVQGVNMGGNIKYNWGTARFLPAFHSSSTPDGKYAGMPASILFDIYGTKIYHAGDTCLNSEMKTAGEIYKPDIALLPVGSFYTMDTKDALTAAKWLNVKRVIPMHYNTFPAINVNIEEFKTELEKSNIECVILKPGESLSI